MPNIAQVGALIGDPVRAAILGFLMDGSERPAGELAFISGASPQAASSHLARLLDGGLLAVTQHGRHRYYRLRDAEVAHAIETLSVMVAPKRNLRVDPALRQARRCYDHLAGAIAVQLCDLLIARDFIAAGGEGYCITDRGWTWLHEIGLERPKVKRPLVRACLDWTERRMHIAGWLGAVLYGALEEGGVVQRLPGTRAVKMTGSAQDYLEKQFGL